MDDIKEFLAGLIYCVTRFTSTHVICYILLLFLLASPQSCAFLHDIVCLASKNKTEGFFLLKNAAACPTGTVHLLSEG